MYRPIAMTEWYILSYIFTELTSLIVVTQGYYWNRTMNCSLLPQSQPDSVLVPIS